MKKKKLGILRVKLVADQTRTVVVDGLIDLGHAVCQHGEAHIQFLISNYRMESSLPKWPRILLRMALTATVSLHMVSSCKTSLLAKTASRWSRNTVVAMIWKRRDPISSWDGVCCWESWSNAVQMVDGRRWRDEVMSKDARERIYVEVA